MRDSPEVGGGVTALRQEQYRTSRGPRPRQQRSSMDDSPSGEVVRRFHDLVRYTFDPVGGALNLRIDSAWFDGGESSHAAHKWLQEIIRLTETTRHGECLPRLQAIRHGPDGISLGLVPMRRRTLAEMMGDAPAWKSVADRRAVWLGFARLARSLERLHQLGYLHRSLTVSSVFGDNLLEPDGWVLGGLESLMRMGDTPSAALQAGWPECGELCEDGFSPDTDWLNFASLLYRALLGVRPQWTGLPPETLAALSSYESAFFSLFARTLAQGRPLADLGLADFCAAVAQHLQACAHANQRLRLRLADPAAGHARRQLGLADDTEGSALCRAIEEDLEQANLIWSETKGANLLIGRRLVLMIKSDQFARVPWDVAFGAECLRGAWATSALRESRALGDAGARIEVETVSHSRFGRAELFNSWQPFVVEPPAVLPAHRRYLEFLALTNAIDAMYRYRELLAFNRVEPCGPGRVRVDLCDLPGEPGQREDAIEDLERLRRESRGAFFLNFTPHATPFAQRQPDLSSETNYLLLEVDPDGRWLKLAADRGSPLLRERRGVLRTAEHPGQIALIDRRRNAFASLASQPLLLQRLVHPTPSITGDLLEKPAEQVAQWIGREAELDDSKRTALQQILANPNPSSVRGPPGTGKTQLLAYMVKCIFQAQPLARILVTAQAQAAVAVMQARIREVAIQNREHLPALAQPKLRDHVRTKDALTEMPLSPETEEDCEQAHTYQELQAYIERRRDSLGCDRHARLFLMRLIFALGKRPVMRRIFFLRDAAAPIVFCSSTAGELVALTRIREAFDWVVVEEAARAHAHDLVLPLGVSARWVFIGDERQLEPFKSEAFLRDVQDANGDVRHRLERMRSLQWRKFLPDRNLSAERATPEVGTWMSPFASMHRAARDGAPLTLATQYRMARPIGDMISEVFYRQDGGIQTAPGLAQDYAESLWTWKGAFRSLNQPAVVWSAIRWANGAKASQYVEQDMTSRTEIDRIVQMMRDVEPCASAAGRPPVEIAVLSPYSRQVALLKNSPAFVAAFRRLCTDAGEPGLDDPARMEEFLHQRVCTVDSFQGCEADLVFVSLVRNNLALSYDGPEIGFLDDPRRANVMLSRARRQLVLVGAWEQFSGQKRGHWPQITRRIADLHSRGTEMFRWHSQGVAP